MSRLTRRWGHRGLLLSVSSRLSLVELCSGWRVQGVLYRPPGLLKNASYPYLRRRHWQIASRLSVVEAAESGFVCYGASCAAAFFSAARMRKLTAAVVFQPHIRDAVAAFESI